MQTLGYLNHSRLITISLIASALFLQACGGGGAGGSNSGRAPELPPVQSVSVPAQTADGWEVASLAEVGMRTQPIIDAINAMRRGDYNEIHGLIIVKDKKLVVEEYGSGRMYDSSSPTNFGPVIDFDLNQLHILHSVSKSFMSTLVGLAIQEGYIASEDEPLLTYFPEHFNPAQPEKGAILLKHLMTMTSGLEWNEWDVSALDFQNNDAIRYQNAADPSAYFLGKTLIHEPGTSFYYNTAGFQMMGEVLRRATGMPLDQFAEQQLFSLLGITDYRWQQYDHGSVYIVGDIFLRPRDMAKFGQLVLQRGLWNGRQIVPAAWVEDATAKFISVAHTGYKGYQGYGYHWWLKTFSVDGRSIEGIIADGFAGQAIMIFPSLDLVVVATGGNYEHAELEHDLVANHVLPSAVG
jgi:CubicO group peptidase (beta-lactamase class C family)